MGVLVMWGWLWQFSNPMYETSKGSVNPSYESPAFEEPAYQDLAGARSGPNTKQSPIYDADEDGPSGYDNFADGGDDPGKAAMWGKEEGGGTRAYTWVGLPWGQATWM